MDVTLSHAEILLAKEVGGSPQIVSISNRIRSNMNPATMKHNVFRQSNQPAKPPEGLLDRTACPWCAAVRHRKQVHDMHTVHSETCIRP